MSTTTSKETPRQARSAAVASSLTPLYAVAGLTDVLAEEARQRLTEAQKRAQERLAEIRRRPSDLQHQVKHNADELARFVADLPVHLRALPSTTRERAQQLSEQATERLSEAGSAYEDLAGRGRRRVDEVVTTAQTFRGRARRRAEEGLKQADPVFETVQEAATQLRKSATGRTATETVTPRRGRTSTAKTGTAKKSTPATKAAPARSSAAKKTGAATKSSAARKSTTRA
ncbi:ElaB/YqjD/DUF883 family membrane-anchored ribosome-binding protein [Friedmanniella endophytica]|uniref:ElaB/YqjD/DUF883 family membrane-anchored ribosome-binding protein n=1 Tax=Microlunatus kandeliicorticis TaxID=1759536 RepID=A0A7W3IVY7_9ACTN|nr:hypothetical protein [Microlunatus kandeliicorticis]MBA8796249.1 ElaB/YqjD/DUF883 family membrane-anchored ribosome-binding protein [Microlunatus kandeliicorticis]